MGEQASEKYGQHRKSPVTLQSVRSSLKQELGGLNKDLALDRFDEVVTKIQIKIDATAQGKRNKKAGSPNYHRFGEHPGNEPAKRIAGAKSDKE